MFYAHCRKQFTSVWLLELFFPVRRQLFRPKYKLSLDISIVLSLIVFNIPHFVHTGDVSGHTVLSSVFHCLCHCQSSTGKSWQVQSRKYIVMCSNKNKDLQYTDFLFTV